MAGDRAGPDERRFAILPTATFQTARPADILLVPGGDGAFDILDDPETLAFIAAQGRRAEWVTSVCTGAFPLAQAGLLNGYAAATHWSSRFLLARYGVDVRGQRVVIDRNRVTAGGVTSGIDFALTLIAHLFGEDRARLIQLRLEYDPHPPFDAGSPHAHPAAEIGRIVAANERRRGPLVDAALTRRNLDQ